MNRPFGYGSLLVGLVALAGALLARGTDALAGFDPLIATAIIKLLLAGGLLFVFGGAYRLALRAVVRSASRRRAHDARNVLRLVFGGLGLVAVLGVLTDQWLGVLFSLGVVGFAVTFALQQPLLSLLGWFYIVVKHPYGVGDRVQIDDAKGDVIAVDFLVTTLWEIDGGLVASNQPSGRVVTVPNSVVLSSQVTNFGGGGSPFVWNEIALQVAFETDLEFARRIMIEEAQELLGEEMARRIGEYREALSETPVELEVSDRPSVNVAQQESWVELRLRYLVHPRRGQRVKNELYERILDRFTDHPDRVAFPVSRNR